MADVAIVTVSAAWASSSSFEIEGLYIYSASKSLARICMYEVNVLTREFKSTDTIVSVVSPAIMPYNCYKVTAELRSADGCIPIILLPPIFKLSVFRTDCN